MVSGGAADCEEARRVGEAWQQQEQAASRQQQLTTVPLCTPHFSDAYLAAQQAGDWGCGKAVENYRQVDNGELGVGVMGVGHLGGAAVTLLLAAGYRVSTWTRRPREVPGARCFHGAEQLREFAGQADVVVNLVPLTAETRWVGGWVMLAAASPAECAR